MRKKVKIPAADYLDQVSIPIGKSGEYAIEQFSEPAGKKLDTSNLRTSLVGGQQNEPVSYGHITIWHRLVYEGGVWMTDLPIEQQQHRNCLRRMRGHVLVGGLGLGLATNWLAKNEKVKSVTVVEISKEVVELVAPHVRDPRGIVKIVNADLFDYLKDAAGKKRWDWSFIDIWQSDGEITFFKTVCPLRKLSESLVKDQNVICWNEDVMRGQLYMGLNSRYMGTQGKFDNFPTLEEFAHPKDDDIWMKWSARFFQAVESGLINKTNLTTFASVYSQEYGRPHFEELWESMTGRKKLEKVKA